MISGFFIKNSYCMMIPFEYKNTASEEEAQSSSASLPEFYAKSTQICSELPAEIWEIIIALIDINDDKTISGLMRTSRMHHYILKGIIKIESQNLLDKKIKFPSNFYNTILAQQSLDIIPIHILAHLLTEYPNILEYMDEEIPSNKFYTKNILQLAVECEDKDDIKRLKLIIDIAAKKMTASSFYKFINHKNNNNGRTALYSAIGLNSNFKKAKLLIEGIADVNVKDKANITPLNYTSSLDNLFLKSYRPSYEEFTSITKLLLKHGASIYVKDIYNMSALDNAHRCLKKIKVDPMATNASHLVIEHHKKLTIMGR